jgi:hypothetical protein
MRRGTVTEPRRRSAAAAILAKFRSVSFFHGFTPSSSFGKIRAEFSSIREAI